MTTILLVDDEQRMLDLIELFLLPHGYKTIKETSGKNATMHVKEQQIDLVLLDVMMPEMDGWEVCKEIRTFSKVPIILLTARSEITDKVKGLEGGADDYMTKPFDERELTARVQAILRRTEEKPSNITQFEQFSLDKNTYTLHFENLKQTLTLKEFLIIEAMLQHPLKTFTREELLHAAWDFDTYTDIRTVDSHIRNLRDKLKAAKFPMDRCLKTVWGIGYKWTE